MAVKYSPQRDYFKLVDIYEKINKVLFWGVVCISLVFSFLDKGSLVNSITIFSIVTLSILDYVIDHYRYKAEESRKLDFFDNSFNSRFNYNPSEGYYDNDEISSGLYKMIVNTFESSFFSMEISKKMKEKALFKNLIPSIIVTVFAIYGFARMSIAVPILQLFISKMFIINLIDIFVYHERVSKIFNELMVLFDKNLKNTDESIKKCESDIIKLYMQYESVLSDLKLSLDSNIYNELNELLTEKWTEMKKRYDIN